jgi:predicted NAD-dependent protein-ADP-ribosyltransferase YbiA (DUF1768 family)
MVKKEVKIRGKIYRIKDEGFTHINIYSQANTYLGRQLSNFQQADIKTKHGRFLSLEGYYHWLKLTNSIENAQIPRPERWELKQHLHPLRISTGKCAQDLGRKLRSELIANQVWIIDVPTEEIDQNFEDALYTRIMDDSPLREALILNDLPFTHYYTYNDSIYHKPHYDWLVDRLDNVIERIMEALA